MNRRTAFSATAVILTAACSPFSFAANITYFVEPTALPLKDEIDQIENDYTLDGGFITTDGTLGPLAAANIVDYRIDVSGPYPFVFRHSSPHFWLIEGVTATENSIVVMADTNPEGGINQFGVIEFDTSHSECQANCSQDITWFSTFDTR